MRTIDRQLDYDWKPWYQKLDEITPGKAAVIAIVMAIAGAAIGTIAIPESFTLDFQSTTSQVSRECFEVFGCEIKPKNN